MNLIGFTRKHLQRKVRIICKISQNSNRSKILSSKKLNALRVPSELVQMTVLKMELHTLSESIAVPACKKLLKYQMKENPK